MPCCVCVHTASITEPFVSFIHHVAMHFCHFYIVPNENENVVFFSHQHEPERLSETPCPVQTHTRISYNSSEILTSLKRRNTHTNEVREKKASVISIMQTGRNIIENTEQPRIHAVNTHTHTSRSQLGAREGEGQGERQRKRASKKSLSKSFYYYLIFCVVQRQVEYCVENFIKIVTVFQSL